jgi:2,3-diketo-5-methylthio-1-phosphopentane phosphatase
MNKQKIKIFCDFDGTITTKDVTDNLFSELGNAEKAYAIYKRWMDKEISYNRQWDELFNLIPDLTEEKFYNFVDTIEIEYGFKEFVDFCDKNNLELLILSDGMDLYIKRILRNNGLEHLKFYSNKLLFTQNGAKLLFPYTDEECKECGNCKRNHIINHSSDDDITIYIGDGDSDTCPAQYVDYIFAKKTLLKFLERERISYYPFKNFKDIIARIKPLLQKKKIKKRHQAELKRKAVYALG